MGMFSRLRGSLGLDVLHLADRLLIRDQEVHTLQFYNNTGGSLAAGTLVYISGYNATYDLPTVTKADADTSGKAAEFVVLAAVANAAIGYMALEQEIGGINTNSYTVGDPVYLDATTAGGFTSSAPTGADQISQVVGRVTVKSATVGKIRFFPGRRIILATGTSGLQNDSVDSAQIKAGAVDKDHLAGGFLKVALIDGGSAGDFTVSGIASGDELVFVGHFETKAAIATLANLTSEFSITAANTINNAGGTDTTNDQLMVVYLDLT